MSTTDADIAEQVFFGERFGWERKSLGRRQAIDLARHGRGVKATMKAIGAAFDAAVASGEVQEAGKATFRVGYHMAPGCSAAGSSIGSRPVSADMYTVTSVREWARRYAMSLTK